MTETINRRVTATMEGDFAIFLIGFRINKFWRVRDWVSVFAAMPKMLRELSEKPELGLLHYRLHFGLRSTMVVQYWRNFEALHAYAMARNCAHLPAWQAFNAAIGMSGSVGIWHETYLSGPDLYENIYVNMPPFGLGRAGTVVDASGALASAAKRLRRGVN
jgi:hypothetical protein